MTDHSLPHWQRAAAAHVNGALTAREALRAEFARPIDLQRMGRAPRMRIVHAARARKLRRRGEKVAYFGRTSAGQARYAWYPLAGHAMVIDYVPWPTTPIGGRWTISAARSADAQQPKSIGELHLESIQTRLREQLLDPAVKAEDPRSVWMRRGREALTKSLDDMQNVMADRMVDIIE